VPGGVLEHCVVLAPGDTLLVSALRGAAANPLQPIGELVANRLQLADAGDPRGRTGERLGRRLRDAGPCGVLGIGGQLSFEAGDLLAQRTARGALAGGVRDLRGCGEIGELGARRFVRPQDSGKASCIQRPGQLARLDADLASRSRSVGRNTLEVRRDSRIGGNESPRAMLGDDQAFVFKAAVERPRRVHVHASGRSEVANARQTVPGRQAAAEDQRSQAPGEAQADRQLLDRLGLGSIFVPTA
jgi:hypothetical protein